VASVLYKYKFDQNQLLSDYQADYINTNYNRDEYFIAQYKPNVGASHIDSRVLDASHTVPPVNPIRYNLDSTTGHNSNNSSKDPRIKSNATQQNRVDNETLLNQQNFEKQMIAFNKHLDADGLVKAEQQADMDKFKSRQNSNPQSKDTETSEERIQTPEERDQKFRKAREESRFRTNKVFEENKEILAFKEREKKKDNEQKNNIVDKFTKQQNYICIPFIEHLKEQIQYK
jgi:hypothetical protein